VVDGRDGAGVVKDTPGSFLSSALPGMKRRPLLLVEVAGRTGGYY
jgi:hypothetical protein